jgi:aminopeptidase N
MKRYLLFALFFLSITILIAQNYNTQLNSLNVEHYKLSIDVNDQNDSIKAEMAVNLKFKKSIDLFYLDLFNRDSISGKGMVVDSVYQNKIPVEFTHSNNKLQITPKHNFPNLPYTYLIKYKGIPKDGLIISKNVHGDRTFFGDNWPNRAHHWFPCIDHPSDKATIEYIITAPNHYQTIANGFQIEETNIDSISKLYHWKTEVPIPTKVMVIGVAKFAVQNLGETHNVPISTWVYPQTKNDGFSDFEIAKDILDFFIENVGDYPFKKLANVQSKTRFGGMENAGNIFYYEKSVTGEQKNEYLIAHEIAHQWFGNSATEIDWPHVWLSEGFATYLTDLYVLAKKGEEEFLKRIQNERQSVVAFYKKNQSPVVDFNTKDYMRLLNTNSYQKGAWFLHMLRHKIGEENFNKGIQNYYKKYAFKNASTQDLNRIMNEVSNSNLNTFFNQWLLKSGHPILKTNWIYGKGKLRIMVNQTQEKPFIFPLELELVDAIGNKEMKTINITSKDEPFVIETSLEVKTVNLDPNTKLLFEIAID